MSMTLDEYFDILEAIRDRFEWKIEPDTGWYSDGRAARRGWIRGRPLKGPAAGAILDPIGAVCYSLTGKAYGEKSWTAAGRELGLPPSEVADLNAAADARTWDGRDGRRKPVKRLEALRERLLACLNMTGHQLARPAGPLDQEAASTRSFEEPRSAKPFAI